MREMSVLRCYWDQVSKVRSLYVKRSVFGVYHTDDIMCYELELVISTFFVAQYCVDSDHALPSRHQVSI